MFDITATTFAYQPAKPRRVTFRSELPEVEF
jgi:hypothetical protein